MLCVVESRVAVRHGKKKDTALQEEDGIFFICVSTLCKITCGCERSGS